VTVNYATSNDTAVAGSDYTTAAGTLTFAKGETSKTFTVAITNDTLSEPNERLNLTLSDPTAAPRSAAPTFRLAIVDMIRCPACPSPIGPCREQQRHDRRHLYRQPVRGERRTVTVSFATANGRQAPSDYTGRSGVLTFGRRGQQDHHRHVAGTHVRGERDFFVNLSGAACHIADSQGLGTITNDDSRRP